MVGQKDEAERPFHPDFLFPVLRHSSRMSSLRSTNTDRKKSGIASTNAFYLFVPSFFCPSRLGQGWVSETSNKTWFRATFFLCRTSATLPNWLSTWKTSHPFGRAVDFVRSRFLRSTVLGLMMLMVRPADFTRSDEGYYLKILRASSGAHMKFEC